MLMALPPWRNMPLTPVIIPLSPGKKLDAGIISCRGDHSLAETGQGQQRQQ